MVENIVKRTTSVTYTSLFLHLCGALWYTFVVFQDKSYHNLDQYDMFGGRTQFLTMITLYLTFMASVFAFLVDASEIIADQVDAIIERKHGGEIAYISRDPDTLMISIRDEIMGTWVQTLCTFVPLSYWGTSLIDRSAIHNEDIVKFTPIAGWFNHALHSVPMVWTILTNIYVDYEYPSLCGVFKRMAGFTAVYITWLKICTHVNGNWAYDFSFLRILGDECQIFGLANIFMFSLTLVSFMHRKISTWLCARIYKLKLHAE